MGIFEAGPIFPNGLSLDDGLRLVLPVLVVVLGMTAYAVFVFKFYRFVAARDMFRLDLSKNDAVRDAAVWNLIFRVWYVVRYVVLFPAFAFFWFAVLTLILVFLSADRGVSTILLIAMATVSAIRVSAYYNEELSRDLAKILPFAVLGVFIIDTSSFDVGTSLATLREINQHREAIAYYLMFLVALEFGLRFVLVAFRLVFPGRKGAGAGQRPAAPRTAEPAPAQSAGDGECLAGDGAGEEAGGNGRKAGVVESGAAEREAETEAGRRPV